MRKAINEWLARIFPEKVFLKWYLIRAVLTADWRPYYLRGAMTLSRRDDVFLEEFFAGMDAASLKVIKDFMFLNRLNYENTSLLAVNYSRIFTPLRERELLAARQRYFLTDGNVDASSLLYHHGLRELPPAVRQFLQGGNFIDAGACHGDSTLVFMEYAPAKVYAFEPSPGNRQKFLRTMSLNQIDAARYELVDAALGETAKTVFFTDTAGGDNNLSQPGDCPVRMMTLDSFTADRQLPVRLIKADIEGMGLELLHGAIETIRRDRPLLTLSIYHNDDEFFGQYELLKSLQLDYCFMVRSLTPWLCNELSLLAVPRELMSAGI